MPAGRPPKPIQIRRIQGNPGRRPLPENEPQPPAGEVNAPSWLTARGKRAWREMQPVLEAMHLLTTADTQALSLLCDAYAEYIEARAVIKKLGPTYETVRVLAWATNEAGDEEPSVTSTMVRARPEVAIASDAWRRVSLMLQQFGMTPSSRSKVQATAPAERDPLGEFLSDRTG